ncbi:copper homeostasis protein CutC [Bacteroidales bacterium OttesenSCG-928-M11]|nr:copper homeostasis protein CutC [Bacteroidales bacterium OttesenSCG-928-M11]
MALLEVCCSSIESALIAQKAGADRIEFCYDLSVGGITPDLEEILKLRQLLTIPLNVLVRPRAGNFVYSEEEFNIMLTTISYLGTIACDGVVIGVLNNDTTIDTFRMKQLIDEARRCSLSVTFHRAIDETQDIFKALEDVVSLNCDRILTSGGFVSAEKGSFVLKQLNRQANERIIIMPGAGVSPENIKQILEETGCVEIHGSFQGSEDKIKKARSLIS